MIGAFGAGPMGSRQEMCISLLQAGDEHSDDRPRRHRLAVRMLNHYALVPMDQAMATAEEIYKDHEATPNQRNMSIVRLCRSCASKTGVPVHDIDKIVHGAQLAACIQPEDL